MKSLRKLSQNRLARRVFLPILRMFAFDFTMRHPCVPALKIKLNSFLHKGYWFSRENRERLSMELFAKLIPAGAKVVEVGGHIGFITTYFAKLATPQGGVTVFEPGSNNLSYIKHNTTNANSTSTLAPIKLVTKAVGQENGTIDLFEDNLTGQNNSVISDFEGLKVNAQHAHIQAKTTKRTVELVRLDTFLGEEDVDFIKIDVEGYELGVLNGMTSILKNQKPMVMVEVQASRDEILALMDLHHYLMFDTKGARITDASRMQRNLFCLHNEAHQTQLSEHFGL